MAVARAIDRRVTVRHVALLRGINVGRAKRIAMADLRKVVEDLGYGGVRTLLNSGNVVFSEGSARADKPGARIERALADQLGVAARVFVLDAAALAAALATNPLEAIAHNPSKLLLAVPQSATALRNLAPLVKQDWSPEALALGKGVAVLWCAGGIAVSKLVLAVNRALGDGVTMRNWATMTKLLALAQDVQ